MCKRNKNHASHTTDAAIAAGTQIEVAFLQREFPAQFAKVAKGEKTAWLVWRRPAADPLNTGPNGHAPLIKPTQTLNSEQSFFSAARSPNAVASITQLPCW